jgi:predicted PhzF superfamily epimerase YddE/YHI9
MGVKLMKVEINATTGEVLERELNSDELKQEIKDHAELSELKAAKMAEEEAKATAKADLLARLGITADEAKLLLG